MPSLPPPHIHTTHQGARATSPSLWAGGVLLHVAVMKTVFSVTLYLYKDNETSPGCIFSRLSDTCVFKVRSFDRDF